MVQEHRPEEVELVGEDGRHHEEYEEDGDAGQDGHLGHHEGAKAQKRRPPIDEQHGLSLIKSLVDKTMMNVPAVRLPYAHMGATSPDNGREGVDDGYRRYDQGDDDGGEARHARDREQRDHAQHIAQEQRARVAQENRGRVEVVEEKANRCAHESYGQGGGVVPAREYGEDEHRHRGDARDAGRQPVQAIDEVEDVDVGNEVDDRDGVGEPAQEQGTLREGVHDRSDDQPTRDGEARRDELAEELLPRRELEDVIEDSRQEDGDKAQGDPVIVHAREVRRGGKHRRPAEKDRAQILRGKGRHNAHEHGDAAHTRSRLPVDASGARPVHCPQRPCDPLSDGRDQQCRHERRKKQAEVD